MANRNFMQEDSIEYLQLLEHYTNCLKEQIPCEIPNGTGGVIVVKELGWYKAPIGKVYFIVEEGTLQKYDLTTLNLLVDKKRE